MSGSDDDFRANLPKSFDEADVKVPQSFDEDMVEILVFYVTTDPFGRVCVTVKNLETGEIKKAYELPHGPGGSFPS